MRVLIVFTLPLFGNQTHGGGKVALPLFKVLADVEDVILN